MEHRQHPRAECTATQERQEHPGSESQLERFAELIAEGQMAWPADLPQPQQEELTARVRQKLRSDLMQFIARLIAAEFFQERSSEEKSC